MRTKDISFYITSFFSHYLVSQRNVSENTVKAYRDTLSYLQGYHKEKPPKRNWTAFFIPR